MATPALNRVAKAAEQVEHLRPRLERARRELHDAIREAHDEGASVAVLTRVSGLSRQRVGQIIAER